MKPQPTQTLIIAIAATMRLPTTKLHRTKRGVGSGIIGLSLSLAMRANLSGRRVRNAKLFANCSSRIANPFDCARQLVFGHAKMPRPVFNVVGVLDNNFAPVRSDYLADHFFTNVPIVRKQTRGCFVPPDEKYVKSHTGGDCGIVRGNYPKSSMSRKTLIGHEIINHLR